MPTSTIAISVDEQAQLKEKLDQLLHIMRHHLKGDDKQNIEKAFEIATHAHRFQRRLSGEAYMFHPLEVARICHEEIGLGPTAIIAALLHDVVEDTTVTLEEVKSAFDEKICKIVDGLTKLDGLYHGENKNAENLKKVLSTLVEDVRVTLIKMADRIHNLRTIDSMPRHKQLKVAAETMYIYAPLAHRLGLYNIKTEFEERCMKITEPDDYNYIKEKLQETSEERQKYIQQFIEPLTENLDQLNIPYRILGRSKAISSIYNKIKKKKVEFEEIYDLFAVRIIVDVPLEKEKSICWQVYSIITDKYKAIPERIKDWITTPKGNGYESLHTTVIGPDGKFVEIQIRSERMDDIAERGFAAHWKYKGVKSSENVYDKWLDNIRTLLENQQGSDAFEFINDFKTNLFKEEIYVFTPQGDMRILPKGATALDFAFDIHSDIGAKATAIKVNNKLVPISHILQNGDQVKVLTSKNQTPRENWLKFVITGKARSKIRSALKAQQKMIAEIGKEALMRKLRNIKIDFESNVDKLVSHYGYNNRRELYIAIEAERIKLNDLPKYFDFVNGHLERKSEQNKNNDNGQSKGDTQSIPKPPQSEIIINGQTGDSFNYVLSSCCNPVQGDDIFAFMTANAGMKIHRFNCSNANNLFTNYGYRILKAEWAKVVEKDFVVEMKLTGIDTGPGIIQSLTYELSHTLGVNIRSFNIDGRDGFFEGSVKVVVRNKNQLNTILRHLKNLDYISRVERTVD